MDPGIRLIIEQVTQGVPHRHRRKQVGSDLVQQRLKRVIVMPVDDHHVHVGLAQLPRRADTGEPSTENKDTRTRALIGFGDAHRNSPRPWPVVPGMLNDAFMVRQPVPRHITQMGDADPGWFQAGARIVCTRS
jgi:hypothetical protein